MRKSALITITAFLLALPLVSYAVTGDFLVPSWQSPSSSQSYVFGTHVVANGTWQLPPDWVGNIYVYKDAVIDTSTGAFSGGTQATDVNNGKGYFDITNAGGTATTSGTWSFDIGAQTDGTHNMYITFWGGQKCAVNKAYNDTFGTNYTPVCNTSSDNFAPNLVWPDRMYTVGTPPYPRMVITPATDPAFNYANTVVGAPVTNTFYITNTGQGSLTGSISGLPANFSCTSCSYVVNPADGATAHPVYLTYSPPAAPLSVDQNVSFSCGNTSPVAGCEGSAPSTITYQMRHIIGNSVLSAVAPAISVSKATINYGTVNLGVPVADQPISVSNTGGGILSGSVAFDSSEYTCTGPCTYSLNAGQSTTIWIHYVPVVVGTHNDSAGFSGGSGQTVALQSVVNDKPIAQTQYGSVGFGTVNVGSCADRFEYVRNSGAGTLSGAVTVAAPFTCVSASCAYALTNADGWLQVTLRYCPSAATGDNAVASFSNTMNAGAGAISNLSGNGNTSPVGAFIGNNWIIYGTVLVNNAVTGSVTITNTGVGILSGSVGALPLGYTCVDPNCTYNIPQGGSVTITISFKPTLVKSYNGSVILSGVGMLSLYGSGAQPDFGLSYTDWPYNTTVACLGTFVCLPPSGATYDVGTTNFGGDITVQNKSFYLYIMNRGGGANVNYSFPNTAHFVCLGGFYVAVACTGTLSGYGSGPYYERIKMEFRPNAAGNFSEPLVVNYDYGDGVPRTVTLNLVGHSVSSPYLSVSPNTNITLGNVSVGKPTTAIFTVTNTGTGSLDGNVTIPSLASVVPSSSGLVGYWKFDEGAGTTVADSSGGGHPASFVNNPSWTTGKSGKALYSPTATDYVVTSPFSINPNAQTISAWIKLDSLTNNMFISHEFTRFMVRSDGSVNFDWSGGSYHFSPPNTIIPGRWYNLVGVENGAQLRLYVNGVLIVDVLDTFLYGRPSTATGGFRMGIANGNIDEVRFYNRVLSSQEISDLYVSKEAAGFSAFSCISCVFTNLLNGQSQQVKIEFNPSDAIDYAAFPLFSSNGGNVGYPTAPYPSITGTGVLDPFIVVNPTSRGFPDTNQGLYSRRTITITNTGLGILTGNIAEVKAPGLDFYCVLNCTYNIDSGKNIISTIEFAPNSVNSLFAQLTINSNAVNGRQYLDVFGKGIFAPIIDIRGSDTNYGPVVVGKFKDKTFTISNSGSVDLGSGTFVVTGPFKCTNPVDLTDGLCHYNLTAGGQVDITIRFTPTAVGPASGAVWLSGVPLARFFVSGTGVAPAVKFIEK